MTSAEAFIAVTLVQTFY